MKFCIVSDGIAYIVSDKTPEIFIEITELLSKIYQYNIELFLGLYNSKFGLPTTTTPEENSKHILENYGEAPFLNPEFLKLNNEVIKEWESKRVVVSSVLDWLRDKNCNIEEIKDVVIL